MNNYVCSNCGASCYYDGRCGDGPVLWCECSKNPQWIDDGRGGYHVYKNNATPIPAEEYVSKKPTTTTVVVQQSTGRDWSREDD